MGFLKIAVILALMSSTGFAVYATSAKVGAQNPEHPEGISLRDDSRSNRGGGFFIFYGRSHYGGGMRGGK